MENLKTLVYKITALTVVSLLVNTAVYAQGSRVESTQSTRRDTTQMKNKSQATPQEQNQRTDEFRSKSNEFKSGTDEYRSQMNDKGVDYSDELKKDDLPKEVTSSLKELYPAHKVTDVYRGEDDSYKVKVQNKNDKAVVYYSSEGSFLRARNESDMQAFPQEQSQRTRESQNQGNWGTNPGAQTGTQQGRTGTQGQGTNQRNEGQMGTQNKTQKNESSAYPQQQNQRTQDQWGTQEDRSSDRDLGTDKNTRTQSDQRTGTQSQQGTFGTEGKRAATQSQSGTNMGTQSQSENRTGTQSQQGTNRSGSMSQSETNMRTQGQHKMHGDTTKTQTHQGMKSGTHSQYGTSSDRSMSSGQGSASPQNQMQRTGDEDVDYSEELEKNDLPAAVTKSLKELYPAHEIEKVFRGSDDSYKVKVKNQNKETVVYYSSKGDFLRTDNKEKDKKSTNENW